MVSPKPKPIRLSCLAVTVFLTIFCNAAPAIIIAQEAEAPAQTAAQQDNLPEGAIWSFGRRGESGRHSGYYRLHFSPDGKLLAARNRDNLVAIYDTQTQQQICEVDGHDAYVNAIDFSPNGKYLITGAFGQRDDGKAEHCKVWNTQNGNLELDIDCEASAAFFSEDGKQIRILGAKNVRTYDWPSGQLVKQSKWWIDNASPMAMSRDGNLVAFYKRINNRAIRLQLKNISNGSTVVLNGPATIPKHVSISPDGLWIAACFRSDAKVRIWDLRQPQRTFTLLGHNLAVYSLYFSDDSRFLATNSGDDTCIVWDILSRLPLKKFEAHTENVTSSGFGPLDFSLATGASGRTDSSVIVWDFKRDLFPLPEPDLLQPMDENSFNHLWTRMSANPPRNALRATRQMAIGANEMLPFLETKIGLASQAISKEKIEQLIRQLTSRKFAERESATNELKRYRRQAQQLLKLAAETSESSEVLYRIAMIMKQPVTRPKIDPQELSRLHRSILALELVASDQELKYEPALERAVRNRATELLKSISFDHPNIDVANDATSALKRIERRRQQ